MLLLKTVALWGKLFPPLIQTLLHFLASGYLDLSSFFWLVQLQ